MTRRQEPNIGFLILACAWTFLFLTDVSRSDAQVSSRRSSKVSNVLSEPLATQPAPAEEALPHEESLPRAMQSTDSVAARINEPATPLATGASSLESPMARQIRGQLNRQRSFQTSSAARPNRSRAIYNIRNKLRQQDSQTVEELLEEMDRSPAKTESSTDLIEPALEQGSADQDSNSFDTTPQTPAAPDFEFALDSSGSTESTPDSLPNALSNALPNALSIDLPTDVSHPLSYDLSFFELLAIRNHPTLNSSLARILTARHEAVQAGLHPNPRLGLFIDEAGNDNDPGLWGAFLTRNHIRGNKLELGQEIKNREANVREVEFETQALRISTDVRTAFYKLLIEKEKLDLVEELFKNQQRSVVKSNELFESGETPRTDVLQTELQLQRTQVLISQQEIAMQNAWRELTSVVGDPQLEPRQIVGDLRTTGAAVSFEACLAHIIEHSPEIQSAQAELQRIRATIEREIAQTIPDYQTQLTVGRDSSTNHFFTGLQVQFPLQICDQNQGNIAAAKSRLVEAQNDLERIKLDLSKRLAAEHRQYESALAKTNMYINQLLPKSKQTLELLEQGYPSEVSFLQLSTAQKTVIDITLEYLDTLSLLWNSRIKIEGLLLDDSLTK